MLQSAAKGLAWAIPVSELCITLLLLLHSMRLLAFALSLGLMLVFTYYVVYVLSYAQQLPCSCGGVIQSFTWQQHLVFNICLLLLAAAAVVFQFRVNKKIAINP